MLTFTTFALLALSLFTTIMAVTAMRRERAELRKNVSTLDYVLELEKELTSLYEQRAERESLMVEKTQQIHDLQEKLFETKESFKPWIESLQEESDQWFDIAKDRETKIAELEQEILSNKESSYFLLESYQEELDVAQECIWDKQRQVSELAEANQRVADTLLSLSCKEGPVTPVELTQLREIALRWDQIPF